jgi:DNA-binding transcriptional regulator GbsR (MarR family)
LAGGSLTSDRGTKNVVQDWLKELAVTFSEEGIQKLLPRCDKRLPSDFNVL